MNMNVMIAHLKDTKRDEIPRLVCLIINNSRVRISSPCAQFQKQGKDMEKVKQRLAEIANYVDKVRIKSAEGTWRCGCDLLEVAASPGRTNRPVSSS